MRSPKVLVRLLFSLSVLLLSATVSAATIQFTGSTKGCFSSGYTVAGVQLTSPCTYATSASAKTRPANNAGTVTFTGGNFDFGISEPFPNSSSLPLGSNVLGSLRFTRPSNGSDTYSADDGLDFAFEILFAAPPGAPASEAFFADLTGKIMNSGNCGSTGQNVCLSLTWDSGGAITRTANGVVIHGLGFADGDGAGQFSIALNDVPSFWFDDMPVGITGTFTVDDYGEIPTIPEPGTLLLLGSGLVGAAAVAHRRRR